MAAIFRACALEVGQGLQVVGHVVDVLLRQLVGDHLHDGALGPLIGALEHDQLLDEIVGMLAGQAQGNAGTPLSGTPDS